MVLIAVRAPHSESDTVGNFVSPGLPTVLQIAVGLSLYVYITHMPLMHDIVSQGNVICWTV